MFGLLAAVEGVLDRGPLMMAKCTRFSALTVNLMIPESYDPFDFEKGSDKLFLIGTTWIVLFLFFL